MRNGIDSKTLHTRFTNLQYQFTETFDDIKEIKFTADFIAEDKEDLTVEIWEQDGNRNVMITNVKTNEITDVTDLEAMYVLTHYIDNVLDK